MGMGREMVCVCKWSYPVVGEDLGSQNSNITVQTLSVGQGVISNVGNVVGADEGDFAVLGRSEDLVELGDGIYQARLDEVLYRVPKGVSNRKKLGRSV